MITKFDVCKMTYTGGAVVSDLPAVLLCEKTYEKYQDIVDKAFYDMRKELNIRPFDSHRYTLMDLEDLKKNCFLLLDGDEVVCGGVCGNGEVDSIAVNPKYQGQGYGRKMTEFILSKLQERGIEEITLSVTKWNTRAIALYKSMGFEITKQATVTGENVQDAQGNWRFSFIGENAEIIKR